jgi:uncharacterized Tic20 family protein
MGLLEELERLKDLKQSGAISEDEYEDAKAAILDSKSEGFQFEQTIDEASSDEDIWGMFIHLSQFCGYIIPFAGLIAPIVLWQIKKKESHIIDLHGRIVVNWIITAFLFAILFGLLCLVLIGIPLLMALGLVGIIFPIVGGIKANNGEIWKYPCSIEFFTVDLTNERGYVK